MEVMSVDCEMKIYLGGGCNSIVLTSKDSQEAIIVDTKYFRGAKALRKEVKARNIMLVNTHFHLDHARGNRLYPEAYVISGNTNWRLWDVDTARSKRPDRALNPGEEMRILIDDEVVRIIDMGQAHSPNDLVVLFEKRKVLAAGDLVWVDMHPVLLGGNTNLKSWLAYLDRLDTEYDIQTVVPGHGKVSGKSSISEMREYFLSISQAIGSRNELSRLRAKYKIYGTFPVFGGFNRTVRLLRRSRSN
jgi:glyoxylase-like metal-dependent hydrolase (beta-lactamase superfamily II)